MLKTGAKGGYFFHYLCLLIDLDRVNAAEATPVVELFYGVGKGSIKPIDLRIEDVFYAQQYRHLQITLLHAVDDVH